MKDLSAQQKLVLAIRNDDPQAIMDAVSAGADVNLRSESKETPLFSGAYWAKPLAVKALLQSGADVNAQDGGQLTALHNAVIGVREHHSAVGVDKVVETIEVLVKGGADPDITDCHGRNFKRVLNQFRNHFGVHEEIGTLLRLNRIYESSPLVQDTSRKQKVASKLHEIAEKHKTHNTEDPLDWIKLEDDLKELRKLVKAYKAESVRRKASAPNLVDKNESSSMSPAI